MKRIPGSFVFLTACLLVAGCGSLQTGDALARPEVMAALASLEGPLPFRVGVFVAPGSAPEGEIDHGRAFTTDAYRLRKDVASILERAGLFEEVKEVLVRSPSEGTPEDRASEMGLDLLVRVTPRGETVEYLGRNAYWWPSLLVWLLAWFPSWMIRDEDFSLEMHAEFELIRVPGQKAAGFAVRSRTESGLNDMERGFHLLGIFRAPYCLDPVDYRTARRYLRRIGSAEFQAQFLLALAPALREIARTKS